MHLKVQDSKITYVNWVTNRHVTTNYMHIDHTKYTSTLLNIKIQYPHDLYQSYIL